MKNLFLILVILVSAVIPFLAFAQISFDRNLFLNIVGPDVVELQKILNKSSDTQVAESGVGSPGSETDYFGELTKKAVERFQIKFSDFILKPAGLNIPTGYVGELTRSFLNNNFSENTSSQSVESQITVGKVTVTTNSQKPVIESISPEVISGKTKIVITGKNFSDDNTILITLEKKADYSNIKSSEDGTKIEFDFESSIQKTFDEKYSKISSSAKKKVLENFPEYPISFSVISDGKQSNHKTIKFNLK